MVHHRHAVGARSLVRSGLDSSLGFGFVTTCLRLGLIAAATDLGSIRLERAVAIQHKRQRFILQHNRAQRIFRRFAGSPGHCRNRLTKPTRLLGLNHHMAQVTGHFGAGGKVELGDLGCGLRRQQQARPRHSRHAHIVGVHRASRNLDRRVDPDELLVQHLEGCTRSPLGPSDILDLDLDFLFDAIDHLGGLDLLRLGLLGSIVLRTRRVGHAGECSHLAPPLAIASAASKM